MLQSGLYLSVWIQRLSFPDLLKVCHSKILKCSERTPNEVLERNPGHFLTEVKRTEFWVLGQMIGKDAQVSGEDSSQTPRNPGDPIVVLKCTWRCGSYGYAFRDRGQVT